MLDRLASLFRLERRSRLTDAEALMIFGAQPTSSGVSVTAQTALRSPATLGCVRVIAETIGSLPVHLYRRAEDGSRQRDRDHPSAALLAGEWAPWAGGTDVRTAMQMDALLHGAGYALVIRTGGRPREIHRLDPTQTAIDMTGSEPVFSSKVNGVETVYDWRDILYIATPGSAPGRSLCLIDAAREAIGLDLIMAQHQGRIFAGGARPSGVLKTGKGKLSNERMEFLRAQFNATYGGVDKSGRTVILEDEWDFKATQFNSVDMQFLELRKLAAQDIARAFKVPGTLVGDLDRGTWRNVEELSRQFVQMTLLPWLEVWQGALMRTLLTPEERRDLFAEFVVDDLLRGDLVARFTAFRQAIGGSWLTPNEARQMENRAPIEGGDKLILQAGQGAADASAGGAVSPALKAVA